MLDIQRVRNLQSEVNGDEDCQSLIKHISGRQHDQSQGDRCRLSPCYRQPSSGDGSQALDRMRAVGVQISYIVNDVDAARTEDQKYAADDNTAELVQLE